MPKPSGPIAILCAYDPSGYLQPCNLDAAGALIVSGGSSTVDASDVTYTPTTAADWDGGVDPGNQDNANDQLAERAKDLELLAPYSPYPRRGRCFVVEFNILTGNALADNPTALQNFGGGWLQNPAADADSLTFSLAIEAGTYTFTILGVTYSSAGKLDVYAKHESEASYTLLESGIDWYSAGTTYNQYKTFSETLAKSGNYIFKFVINGKNASSGGYGFIGTVIYFKPATD